MQSVGVYSQQVDSVGGSFCLVGALETSAPPENSIRLIRLIRCYFYFSKDADINPLFRLIRSKKSEQKKLETVSL